MKRLCHHISPDVKMAISELLSRSMYSTAQQYGTIARYQTLKNWLCGISQMAINTPTDLCC